MEVGRGRRGQEEAPPEVVRGGRVRRSGKRAEDWGEGRVVSPGV